jgi:hypothetical protein
VQRNYGRIYLYSKDSGINIHMIYRYERTLDEYIYMLKKGYSFACSGEP